MRLRQRTKWMVSTGAARLRFTDPCSPGAMSGTPGHGRAHGWCGPTSPAIAFATSVPAGRTAKPANATLRPQEASP